MPRRASTLPRSLEELRGRRCALWIRESTAGQLDAFGPDAQREQYKRAVDRFGLVDTELAWVVAASGWTFAWRTSAWAEMMTAGVNGQFDVLVAGYASRFSRNLQQSLNAVNDHLHPANVAVLFADEQLLSSCPDHWEQFNREALEAESYSRKLSKRVAEGYAAKRRRLGVPGGNRAPFGTRREGRPSQLVVLEEALALVRLAYEVSAAGHTDREVAAAVGLRLTHVRELLTNPFYVGRLRDNSESALGPLVDRAIFDKVQALRGRYSRRHRGSVHRRSYALSMLLRCGFCGRRLTGHSGRYRHVDACEAFRAAAPRPRRAFSRNFDRRVRGESYAADMFDGMVEAALAKVAASALLMADTVPLVAAMDRVQSDTFAAARIERERDAATKRFLSDRDVTALQAAMDRLDREERMARSTTLDLTPTDVRRYLSHPADLWRETTAEGRRAIAEATFERIDAHGLNLVVHLTPEARRYGWANAFGGEPLVCTISRYGRGERI